MENFVLYEELDRGAHHKTYKGRRKDTINFLTIHRVNKCKRPEITNMVRLMHEIKHKNIVKFYEWYETTNNLWLILELCTGGTLSKLITEDDHLPEASIRKFGSDLVNGLHHIHSTGIVFSDINPNKIVFNGPGDLKFSDFGLSRVEGENLEQLLESYMEAGEGFGSIDPESAGTEKSDVPKRLRTRGTPNYMAPEVLNGEDPSMASDFWSLGCVLHEMFTGHPPFLAEDFPQLRKKILSKDFAPPKVKGSRVNSGKPSAEFQSLLDGLLEKDSKKRIAWPQLVVHPFWQGELNHLTTDDMTTQSVVRQSFRQSVANFPLQMSMASGDDVSKANIGQATGRERTPDEIDGRQLDDVNDASTTMQLPRPDLADREPQVLFTISARPCTAGLEDETVVDAHLTSASPRKMPSGAVSSARRTAMDNYDDRSNISSLVFHATDFQVTPIIDVAKQSQKISFKYDPKALSVPPFPADKLISMPSQDQEKHFATIIDSLSITEKGPPSQRQIQLFNYIATICSSSHIANALVRHGVLALLSRQIKDTQQMELKSRLGLIIGTVANNVTELDQSANIAEVMSTLTEVVRDGFRVTKVKVAVLPAIGELLYLVSTQEEVKRCSLESWAVPSITYNLVIRCLNETEEAVTHQLAVKIIENVATKVGQHSLKFAINDVAVQLWHVFTHATGDMLRITSLSALSRLSRFSPVIVQNVIEKVGLSKLLSALSIPVTRIQQAIVTMLASLITSDSKQTRIIQDKELMHQAMRLLESPSVVIRAKAFLVILAIVTGNNDSLLVACQNRLVMYMERDRRKQAVGKIDSTEQTEYLNRCLDLLMLEMVDAVPQVSKELLTALDSASGRKHPSSVQVKQLRSSLPLLALLQHLVASSAFRSKIISESFMKNLASFLGHVLGIESGTTQIQSATASSKLGPLGTEEFIHTVFAIVENVVQHSNNVTDYAAVVIDRLLPSLAALVSNCTGEIRTSSLRLFSEIVTVFVNQESTDAAQIQQQTKKLHHLVTESLLPQYEQILLDQDPLPMHGLKLLLALVEQYPAFIRDIEQFNLVPAVFQVLVDHQSNPVGSTMQQVAGLLNSLVTRKETNMKSLYDHGFVDHFSYLFLEVSSSILGTEENSGNIKPITTMLLLLLETLHGILKYVSEIVRRALETKKGGGDNVTIEAEQAEVLLLVNKPFTEFVSPLTQLLVHEDSDIADTSLKCLALLLQFFGGDHANSLSVRNMECYSEALKKADLKKQKIILRLIKRLIATDAHHLEMMKLHGTKLAEMIRSIERTASAKAENALSSVATEILKAAGHKN